MAPPTTVATASLPAPGRSPKLLIWIVVAVGLIAAIGAAAYFLLPRFTGGAASTAEAAKPATPEKPIFVMLEPLTVNLQAEGRSRFLQIGMALRVRDEHTKSQIVEFMPELRSRLLVLLSNRPPESLVTPEDKAKLADEIRKALNAPLTPETPELGISSVSFNIFVVQ
ncbi:MULTISPECIES: flagellar basal body-associated protein FliL [unclassified Variovorax]|jgi:flagellar FliL protein|uniref:flagellar basal body-associated protein FliL n=1 Tax=unclassified Variovorax TaxID=663243 RepID=UPI000F7ED351|nr:MULTISPECIES: flagellar basal body-associated protein FliL [unclassified Variovorax]RSZ47267.1 flagellar basal body-associated protein FliL [Variovorax sp. 553]RSZ48610.1 flagellar basal body-associated protein FliL [Variovorax sp. 679]